MIIAVASGKGGTGKTTVAVNLALAVSDGIPSQFLDCDVEEPNAHIFLKPEIKNSEPVFIPIPEVDKTKCTFCRRCAEVCAYHAIAVLKDDVLIFPHLCHGCGGCAFFCPEKAISEIKREIGVIEYGNASKIEFIQGRLNIGEPMATPIIRQMKKRIRETRTKKNEEKAFNHFTIIDVPPGTSCPVIEAVKKSDFCVLVTEPTPFGLNDLILAVKTLRKLRIPMGVVINRSNENNDTITDYCQNEHIPILMEIPFDREIAIAYSKGMPIVQMDSVYREKFKELYDIIKSLYR